MPWLSHPSRTPIPLTTGRLKLLKLTDAAPYPFPGDCGCERFRKARYETDDTFFKRKHKALRETAAGAYFPPDLVESCVMEDAGKRCAVGELSKLLVLEDGHAIYPGGLAGDYLHTRSSDGSHVRKYPMETPITKLQKNHSQSHILCATANNMQLLSTSRKHNKLALNVEGVVDSKYLVNCDLSSSRIASLRFPGVINTFSYDLRLVAEWTMPLLTTAMSISNERCVYAASREKLFLLDERTPSVTRQTDHVDFGGMPLSVTTDGHLMAVSTQSRLLLFDCRCANYPLLQWSAPDCFGSALDMLSIGRLPPRFAQCIYGVNQRSQLFCIPLEPNEEHRVVQTRHPRILDTLSCNAHFTLKEPAHVMSGLDFCIQQDTVEVWSLYRSGRLTSQRMSTSTHNFEEEEMDEQAYVEDLADFLPLRWPKTETVIRPPQPLTATTQTVTSTSQTVTATTQTVTATTDDQKKNDDGMVMLDEEQVQVLAKWEIKCTEDHRIPRAVYDVLAEVGASPTPIHIDYDALDPEILDLISTWPEPQLEEGE